MLGGHCTEVNIYTGLERFHIFFLFVQVLIYMCFITETNKVSLMTNKVKKSFLLEKKRISFSFVSFYDAGKLSYSFLPDFPSPIIGHMTLLKPIPG